MKSSIKRALASTCEDNRFATGSNASGPIVLGIDPVFSINDEDAGYYFGGVRKVVTATTNFDVASLTGAKGEALALQSIHLVVIVIRRTAATSSGSYAIASTPLGLTTGTKTISATTISNQVPIGGAFATYVIADAIGTANGVSTDIAVTLTSPVGFEVDVLIVGGIAD